MKTPNLLGKLAVGTFLMALACAPGAQAGEGYNYQSGAQEPSSQMQQDSGQMGSSSQMQSSQEQIASLSNDLMDKNLKNTQGQELGRIQDVLIDKQTGQVAYVIVQDHVVPFKALQPDDQGQLLVVSIDQQQFQQSPQKQEDMASRDFGRQVHQFYGVAPYWQEEQQMELPPTHPPIQMQEQPNGQSGSQSY